MARIVNNPNVHLRANYSYLGFASRPGQMEYTTIGGNVVVGASFAYSGVDYVSAPRTRITIDPNVRVRGNDTYAGFEDVDGPIAVGEAVEVHENESGLTGQGKVTEIDADRQLVYLSVDWSSLAEREPHHEPSAPQGGLLYISSGQSTNEDDWMSLLAKPCLAHVGFSNTTMWVTAPAITWLGEAVSTWPLSPYLEISSHLTILQPYAELPTDGVVAA